MDLGKLVWDLVGSPDKIGPYKNLRKYFEARRMAYEVAAIDHLIEVKFHADRPHPNQ